MPGRNIRVLLLHNLMTPYRYPLFREIAKQPGIELHVWFMARSASNRRWQATDEDLGFPYKVLPSFQLGYRGKDLFSYILNPTFPFKYTVEKFDVMIAAGWLDFSTQAGFLLSKLLRRRFITWCESTAYEPSWRRTLALPLVRTMVKGSSATIAVGKRSADYLLSLGAREQSLFTAYSTVDVEHFQNVSSQARLEREALKAKLGIRQDVVILYSGQFIERKGLRYLLEAYAEIKARHSNAALVLLGYGPLQSELAAAVASRGLADVHFVGHVEVEEIPEIYAVADVFVLPSLEETWGLVVNEAMACGLPVVVTDRVGSSPDLIHEGENGFVVPAADSAALAARIRQLVEDADLRLRFSQRSTRRIQRFTPAAAAQSFANAVHDALEHR